MLVLTRKPEESIVIGEDNGLSRLMKITVLSIQGNRVKLGFDVADDVAVHRLEVWQQLHGDVLTDRTVTVQNPDPFARAEAPWGADPQSAGLKRRAFAQPIH